MGCPLGPAEATCCKFHGERDEVRKQAADYALALVANRIEPPAHAREACLMADAAFANRRKTLANSCKTYFSGVPELQSALPALFEEAGIDSRRRGETLSQDEFVRLGSAYLAIA